MVLGCFANLVADTEHLAVQMESVIPLLLSCIQHPQVEISSMALLALTNITVDEKMSGVSMDGGVLDILVRKLASPDPAEITQLAGALTAFLADENFATTFFEQKNGFESIFGLLDQQLNPDIDEDADEEDIEDAREDANSVVKALVGVLLERAESGESGRAHFLKNGNAIHRLISYTVTKDDAAHGWSVLPEEASKVIAYLSLSSEINRNVLFPEARVFLEWLNTSRTSGTEERRMSAGMILGNLAEDEATASKLIDLGVSSALCRELFRGLDMNSGSTQEESSSVVEAAQNSEREGKEMRIKHLCCAGLKNLAIHPDHKVALIKLGIIPSLVALLKQRNQVVAHAALTLLKSLLISDAALEPFLAADSGATSILELTSTDEENKKDDHLLYESSRVIGMLSVRHPEIFAPYMVEPSDEFAEQLNTIDGKKRISPFTAIGNLLNSKFAILQKEGATVLASLAKDHPNSVLPISKVPGLLERTLHLIKFHYLKEKDEESVVPEEGIDTFTPLATLLATLIPRLRPEDRTRVREAASWLEQALELNPNDNLLLAAKSQL